MVTTSKHAWHDLDQPLTVLKGVGEKLAARFAALSILTLQDLLFHLPIRYLDRTRIAPLGTLKPGDNVLVMGKVTSSGIRYGRRRMLVCQIEDDSGNLVLRFFHFNAQQQKQFQVGSSWLCFGEVRQGQRLLELVHPECRQLQDGTKPELETSLSPVYPATEGLSQTSIRNAVLQLMGWLSTDTGMQLDDCLPPSLLPDPAMPGLLQSLQYLHSPPAGEPAALEGSQQNPYRCRLAFDELLAHQLSMRLLHNRRLVCKAPEMEQGSGMLDRFFSLLPFTLTRAQQRVCDEILGELRQPWPMQRLVQGDVGSGKTVVAAVAALQVLSGNYQVALMAPTDMLAEQHRQNFNGWFSTLGIQVDWLNGKLSEAARRQVLHRIANGEAKIIIGTHALFQEHVNFARLGLVIIDEQHRFGVHQRLALLQKGAPDADAKHCCPHQLIMTATPIPRTLAMTAYADLDCSVIDEMPPGRMPVETVVVSQQRRQEVLGRVTHACRQGRQAYWVCTLIEESESLQCQAAEAAYEMLGKQLSGLSIGLVHGRMPPGEKHEIMQAFKASKLQLLVATTVIEVGVDVPNASLMIIENAERLGLSQLHQLRGRVGRGSQSSVCVLMYKSPLSKAGRERLQVLRETNDGFKIAARDLQLRGPGELLGTRQTGLAKMKVADIVGDQEWIPAASQIADKLISQYPQCIEPLLKRWLVEQPEYKQV